MTAAELNSCALNASLIILCLTVWRQIHHSRLDFSLDPSVIGLASSKWHLALGLLIGVLLQRNASLLVLGIILLIAYTVRNFYHLARMRATFAWVGQRAPSPFRSSMVRQQTQLHVGIGAGGLLVHVLAWLFREYLLRWEALQSQNGWITSTPTPGPGVTPLRVVAVLCIVSLVLAIVQLMHAPLSVAQRSQFKRWQQYRDTHTSNTFSQFCARADVAEAVPIVTATTTFFRNGKAVQNTGTKKQA
jgi:hypothetical protein